MVVERNYWNPIEVMDRKEIEELQLKKMKRLLKYAYHESPFYHRRFDEAKVKPEDIRTFDDFRKKIPIFRKDDIRAERDKIGDAFGGLLCASEDDVTWIAISTGTSGIPTFLPFTDAELSTSIESCCRTLWMAGIRPGDNFLFILITWHWATTVFLSAMHKLGVRPIVEFAHPTTADRIPRIMKRYKVDCALLPISILLAVRDKAKGLGLEPKELFSGMKVLFSGAGEKLTPGLRRLTKEEWEVGDVFDFGGLGEGHLFAVECPEHNWNHLWDDMGYAELVDPDTNEPIDPEAGERGELVYTALNDYGHPFVRYGTEDVAQLFKEKCECGRTHTRMNQQGRMTWRLNVGGKILLPEDVRQVIEEISETAEGAFSITKDKPILDKLKIDLHYDASLTKDTDELVNKVKNRIKEKLGVDSEIRLAESYIGGLPFVFHKIERVMDMTKRK